MPHTASKGPAVDGGCGHSSYLQNKDRLQNAFLPAQANYVDSSQLSFCSQMSPALSGSSGSHNRSGISGNQATTCWSAGYLKGDSKSKRSFSKSRCSHFVLSRTLRDCVSAQARVALHKERRPRSRPLDQSVWIEAIGYVNTAVTSEQC